VLEFRVLGPLEVVGEAGALRLGVPRQRATLAILLLQANRVVPVERLAEELYGGRPPVSAVTQVQRQISELRRVLGGADAIETRPPGYVLHLRDDDFDLARFELLTAKAERARAREDVAAAAGLLREALDLWRGPPLADLAYESFARAAVERLEELRLAALEARIEADLALGRHAALAAELEGLVAEHPLRERLRGQQILALYRSGRQAEALEVYRLTRQALVESFGIEPSAPLQALERAILTQDPALDPGGTPVARPARTVLVAPSRDKGLEALVELGAALPVQLVVARLVLYERELTGAATAVGLHRSHARTAAFTSDNPAADLVRLASANDADLVLVDAPPGLDAAQLPPPLAALLERSPAHVGVLSGNRPDPARGVYVPFGGGEHDWAALELGAWPRRRVRRCDWWAHAPTRAAVAATRAACSPTLRSPSSASQTWMRRPCLRIPTGSSMPSRRPASSRSASPRAGGTRALALRGAPSSAPHGRPFCSFIAGRDLAVSRRARAARVSRGRSAPEPQVCRGQSARRSSRSVAAVVTSQPIRGETYCPNENVP
jgi:DNA-binding SARP family transcriptional activator